MSAELPREGPIELASLFPAEEQPDVAAIAERDNSRLAKIRKFLAAGPQVAAETLEQFSDLSAVSRRIVKEEPVLPGIFGVPERLVSRAVNAAHRRTAAGLGQIASASGQAVGLLETVAASDSRRKLRALRVFDKFNSQGADLAPLAEKFAPLARRVQGPLNDAHSFVEKLADWVTPEPPDDIALA